MLPTQRKHYKLRKQRRHKIQITNFRDKDQRDFDALILDVFADQPATYPTTLPAADQRHCIAYHFYTQCYDGPQILNGASEGAPVKVKEFIDEGVLKYVQPFSNRICLLLGEVGCGKTAFINYLITKPFPLIVESGKLWFLRFDVQGAGKGTPLDRNHLITRLTAKLADILDRNQYLYKDKDFTRCHEAVSRLRAFRTEGSLDKTAQPSPEKSRQHANAFIEVLRAFRAETQRHFVLILDNLDYLCHINDRGLFQDGDDTGELPFLLQVSEFISMFLQGGELDNLGMSILVSSRPDTYEILRQADTTSFSTLVEDPGCTVYTIPSPPFEAVLAAREKLLEFAASQYELPGKKKRIASIAMKIKSDLGKAPRLTEHLQKLTEYGFRSVMLFFSHYGWVGEDEPDGRFIHQIPVALITFMLNTFCRFNQFDACFPNIYLINIQSKEDGSTAHHHPHTYWLKRMVIHLLERKEAFHPSDVIAIFHAGGAGYPLHVIKEVLGSLCEVNGSNMIRCNRQRHLDNRHSKLRITELALTERGRHCVSRSAQGVAEIFDRFYYLQLIVDDYMLPIPRVLEDEFDYTRPELDLDYSYVLNEANYWEEAKKMITIKAKQVLLFLKVLDISLVCEEQTYRAVYSRLRQLGVRPPNMSKIITSVLGELEAVSRARGNFLDVHKIRSEVESYEEPLRRQLVEAYKVGKMEGKPV